MKADISKLITVAGLAKRVGRCEETIRRWARNGKVEYFRCPGFLNEKRSQILFTSEQARLIERKMLRRHSVTK